MKKGIWLSIVIALVLMVCETGIEVNLSTAKIATSNIIKFESGLLGSTHSGLLTISWHWTIKKPDVGDGVIVRRSTDSTNFYDIDTVTPFDTTMTFKTTDTSLVKGGTKAWYELNYWNGQNIEAFDTVPINILPAITYAAPTADTLRLYSTGDTLTVTWRTIKNRKGEQLKDYRVEIYNGKVSLNPDSVLNLINPVDFKEVTGIVDSIATYKFPTDSTKYPYGTITNPKFYTIKVSLKTPVIEAVPNKLLTLTDLSFGVRAFLLFKR